MADRLVDWLQANLSHYLDDLRTLVSIDSGSFDKAGTDAVTAWLQERLLGLGYHVERFPQEEFGADLLATRRGRGAGSVLLLGHADTVFPAGTAQARPLHAQGEKLMGPGVCDMKGGLLAGLYALAALQSIGWQNFSFLRFLVVTDEEISQRHSVPLIQVTSCEADAVLVLEAARENGDLVTARKAIRWYRVEAQGRAAHAGVEPEKGCNAIIALAHAAIAMSQLNGLRPDVTVNVGTIAGGSAPNIVPDQASLLLEVRAFAAADLQVVEKALVDIVANPAVPGAQLALVPDDEILCPPMERTSAVAELEQAVQRIAADMGFDVHGARTGGVSDGNYAAAAGTPVLDGLGPVGGRDHSPDEYVLQSTIVPRTALLARLIMSVCERRGS